MQALLDDPGATLINIIKVGHIIHEVQSSLEKVQIPYT